LPSLILVAGLRKITPFFFAQVNRERNAEMAEQRSWPA
jgi:hypothetical protein